jgi:hypothetical protein
MLLGDPDVQAQAEKIVRGLSHVDTNTSHGHHIHIDACEEPGLRIERLEGNQDLQEAALTVHHCCMQSRVSGATKIAEDHQGQAFVNVPA